jgi:hypothetical protein
MSAPLIIGSRGEASHVGLERFYVEGDHTMRNFILASAALATAATGIGLAFSTPALAQAGSYQRSCRAYSSSNGVLTAECADAQGRYHQSTLNTAQCRGDIANSNGMLACPGGQASGGQVVQNQPQGNRGPQQAQNYGGQPQPYDQGRNDRRDDRTGAVIAGAVVGALLGANGQPVAAPPAYGDPRYGDPRYDYRYQQGWYGYGRQPGEWVSIRDRENWLDMRIDRGVREGRLSRGDARDLRRQLSFIEDQEARYSRDGRLDARERADLDRRFDDLAQRIRFESAQGGGDRDRYGDRDHDDRRDDRGYDRR